MPQPTEHDDDVTEVMQMLEQQLAAYEEQEELAAIGAGRGRGRAARGGRGRGATARMEMEDLVDLAHEAALSRYSIMLCNQVAYSRALLSHLPGSY